MRAVLAVAVMIAGAAVGAPDKFDHGHEAWTAVLHAYSNRGVVAYMALKDDGEPPLDRYLASLAKVTAPQFSTWNDKQKLAFWINAYNASAVNLILQNYPLSSIKSIGLLPNAAFRSKFIPIHVRGDADLSLSDVEALLAQFKDPRVHFALVNAAKSSPELRSTAYRADALDSQLEDAAQRFISDKEKNRLEANTKTLRLSSVFKWHRQDFERGGQTLAAYVANFLDADEYQAIKDLGPAINVEFLDFDWQLNGH